MLMLAVLGYVAVGLSYLVLSTLLLTVWRGQRLGVLLIAACVVSIAWSAIMVGQMISAEAHPHLIYTAEIGRLFAWVGFLVYLAAKVGISRPLRALCVAIGAAGLLAYPVLSVVLPYLGVSVTITQLLVMFGLALSLCGLLLIEQLYRNSTLTTRWGLKALSVGLGGLFAYELYYYSQALLFSALDTVTWLARGWVNVIFVPAIAIAARRSPDWKLRIFVSRQVVFYTTTLVAVGVYFLLMGLGGFLLLKFGGSWGALARAVFLVGAAVVLAALMSSSTLRARFKVFLSKHFFQNKYDYREEWLRLVSTLADFEGGRNLSVAVKAIAQIVGSSSGVLWFVDEKSEKLILEARYDLTKEFPDISMTSSLIEFMEKTGWVVDLVEYRNQPDKYAGLEVPDWLMAYELGWLLVPLQSGQQVVGLVMLNKAPVLPKMNYEDHDLLKTAGNHIAVHLMQARSDQQLSEARQFEAFNRLTAFLMHDLNNLIAQQSLIVSNAEKHRRNPEFVDDAIATISGSVERMKRVMRTLKGGAAESPVKQTELKFIVSAAADRCAADRPIPALHLDGVDACVSANPSEFTMVLAHLIKNAQDACDESGHVDVRLEPADGGGAMISVIDDGMGMSAEFVRERLFRPFDSTKGVQGMGIGAYQAREFARRLGGDLRVDSKEGEGTHVRMTIPCA